MLYIVMLAVNGATKRDDTEYAERQSRLKFQRLWLKEDFDIIMDLKGQKVFPKR